jgi:flagellar motility protein MotE (MotC chaperone)
MKIAQLGILIAAVAWLLLSMADAWADDIDKQYEKKDAELKERQTFEEIVADTLTFEEYAEWTANRQKFQALENKEKERQLACVEKGGHPKQCVDPHWCLYPTNEKNTECVKYYVKRGIF